MLDMRDRRRGDPERVVFLVVQQFRVRLERGDRHPVEREQQDQHEAGQRQIDHHHAPRAGIPRHRVRRGAADIAVGG